MREQEWLSLREAADALGISEVSARRWVKSGKLEAAQPGRKYIVPREAVEELLRPKASPPPASRATALAAGLREHGIEVNDSEAFVLNQYLEVHENPPTGIYAIVHVAKEGEPVDHERVKTLLAYVVASGMLTEDATEAARKALHAELVGTSA